MPEIDNDMPSETQDDCLWREIDMTYLRWKFLSLLERDCHFLVACPECNILHHPMKHPTLCGLPRVTRNLVRAIATQLALGRGHEEECREVLDLAAETKSVIDNGVRAVRTLLTRVIDNSLICRSQILIAPCVNNGDLTSESFRLLIHSLSKSSFQICAHFNWPSFFQFLNTTRDDRADQESQFRSSPELLAKIKNLNAYFAASASTPEHRLKQILCHTLYELLYSLAKHGETLGDLRSCHKCAIDVAIGVKHVAGLGPVLAMTTWRDLGGLPLGGNIKDDVGRWRWDSH